MVEGAPADAAGLRPGDLIVAVDGEPVQDMNALQRLMVGERIGTRVTFSIARLSRLLEVVVTPAELRV